MKTIQSLKIKLSYDPVITILAIYSKKMSQFAKEISEHPSSLKRYSQRPRFENNLTPFSGFIDKKRKNCDTQLTVEYSSLTKICV